MTRSPQPPAGRVACIRTRRLAIRRQDPADHVTRWPALPGHPWHRSSRRGSEQGRMSPAAEPRSERRARQLARELHHREGYPRRRVGHRCRRSPACRFLSSVAPWSGEHVAAHDLAQAIVVGSGRPALDPSCVAWPSCHRPERKPHRGAGLVRHCDRHCRTVDQRDLVAPIERAGFPGRPVQAAGAA